MIRKAKARTTGRRRVAIVVDAIYPFRFGGKETRYFEVVRRLGAQLDLHVYTMHWWDGPARVYHDGNVTFHAVCGRHELYRGNRRSIRQALAFAVGCLRLLGARFDVIEADHMPYLQLFSLRLVAWLRRRRLIVTWHEVWGREYWVEYLGAAGIIGYWIETWSAHLPNHILAASEQTADRLRSRLNVACPITVAPNGVDLAVIAGLAPHPEPTDVITVGRLLPHKRVDLLLDAVALLRADRWPDLRCRIIGAGPEAIRLRQHAVNRGIADAVEWLDAEASHDAVLAHVKSARSFALMSEREGFGIALLEAIACRTPVVTTNARDNLAARLVGDDVDGLVCDPDPASVATALSGYLQPMAKPAAVPPSASQYDWAVVAGLIEQAINAEAP